jgi:hypothetical protein
LPSVDGSPPYRPVLDTGRFLYLDYNLSLVVDERGFGFTRKVEVDFIDFAPLTALEVKDATFCDFAHF